MIKTNDDLIDYIMRQLGYPSVEVELTPDQLQDCIDYSIKEFSSFAWDGELEESVVLTVDGRGIYQLPDFITSIIDFRSIQGFQNYGQNYIPDRWSEEFFRAFESNSTGIDAVISISNTFTMYEKYMQKEINYFFNAYKGTVQIMEEFSGNVVIHYTYEYRPDKKDKIYDHQWVKDMSVAKARYLQSTVTGKYSQALVGGATINYDDMRSKAETEIEDLKEQLFNKYGGPAPILIM
jgi:hypothetical protein